jgi:hypothetical protein
MKYSPPAALMAPVALQQARGQSPRYIPSPSFFPGGTVDKGEERASRASAFDKLRRAVVDPFQKDFSAHPETSDQRYAGVLGQ